MFGLLLQWAVVHASGLSQAESPGRQTEVKLIKRVPLASAPWQWGKIELQYKTESLS